ncbi:MAG: glycosyltransferase family 4 protein [Acidisphaera sp.]|nr:glycosyltransferase family 4 protein [Acidisphaera sp.]
MQEHTDGGRPVVLQVVPALDTGGVERGTVEIAQAIVQAGGTALVASEGGRMVAALDRAGAQHVTLPLARKNPAVMWRNAGRLAALVRGRKVDIVHARSRAPAWSAWLACRRTGVRFLTTYHGVYNEELPGKRLYNAVMARGERVIAISDWVAGHLIARHGIDPARVRVISRGVDAALFDPDAVSRERIMRLATDWRLPEGRPTVMLPGRLTRWKGQGVLIAAMAALRRRDALCVLVGSDQGRRRYSEWLMREAERLGVAERVRLVGECDDMPAALMLAEIVVNASTDPEGFGRTIIEAQAMRRLTVASDHGGAVETVEHGVTGWRVPPGDAAALAAMLDHALDLPAPERRAMGQRARAAVLEHFTVTAMQQATIEVYGELLRTPS